jgi:protein-glutamine gamma-glutamyltransferase
MPADLTLPGKSMALKAPGSALSAVEVTVLLLMLCGVGAPHVSRISLWAFAAAGSFVLFRLLAAWRNWPLPGKWLRVLLVLTVCCGIVLDFSMRFGRDAAVSMLLLMAALKALELRAPRDALVLINLSYFLIITNFLYSQSIALALYMLVLVVLITALLIALQRRRSALKPIATFRLACILLLQAVPLMLALFFLFPRVQGPLFGWSQSAPAGLSGLSEEMSPGSLSELSLSDEVAFRVQFESTAPKPSKLYWRGPVLWDFDGRTWRMAKMPLMDRPVHQALSTSVRYLVTLEPNQTRWLFAIDLPARVPIDALLSSDYQIISRQPLRHRQQYIMESNLDFTLGLATCLAYPARRQRPRPRARARIPRKSQFPAGHHRSGARALSYPTLFLHLGSPCAWGRTRGRISVRNSTWLL